MGQDTSHRLQAAIGGAADSSELAIKSVIDV